MLANVGSLELAPVAEESAPSFSDTLSQHIKESGATKVAPLDADDKKGVMFKHVISSVLNKCEKEAEKRGVMFQADIDPVHVEVKMKHLEKVFTALVEECLLVDSLNAIVIASQMEFGEYVIRITGFMARAPQQPPRHLSNALREKAKALGMQLDYRYKPDSQVDYDISMELEVEVD